MINIGILTPRSSLYPTISFDIVDGLKTGFAYQNFSSEINLFIDNIGFGIDEQDIYSKAEKMLLSNNADIVIACCDSKVASMLQPLFIAAGKLLLVVNMGANLPEGWKSHPTTITNSLNFCFNTALTGALAAANKMAAFTCSYYDAGYNQVFTMLTRFQQKEGNVLFNHVTHLKNENFTLQPLQDFMAAEKGIQNLLCLFCADMSVLFYKQMQQIQKIYPCNLFVSPMMLDESLTTELNNEVVINNIQGYLPWHSLLKNEANQKFVETYKAAHNKVPNIFALLGWDTALIIKKFSQQLSINNNNTANAVQALQNQTFNESPRGWIKLDSATNQIYGPAYLAKASNHFDTVIEENMALNIDAEWQSFHQEILQPGTDIHSAWRNTYLCI